jgi:hypothetical protein
MHRIKASKSSGQQKQRAVRFGAGTEWASGRGLLQLRPWRDRATHERTKHKSNLLAQSCS